MLAGFLELPLSGSSGLQLVLKILVVQNRVVSWQRHGCRFAPCFSLFLSGLRRFSQS